MHFLRTLHIASRKTWKTLFSHTFCGTSCKKLNRRCYLAFLAKFVQSVSRNLKKNIVFSHFSRNLAQKAQKTLFSHNLRTLCIVPRKTWKSTVFSHILLNVVQDDQRTLIFAFSAKNVQSVSKDVEKHGFLTLFAERRAKSSKTVFFAFLLRTLYKVTWRTWKNIVFTQIVSKNEKKYSYLTVFVGRRAKSSKNHVFSFFFAIFVQNVSKNVKKALFSHIFCGTSCKKLKKRCFSHFLRTLHKVSRKTWKTQFSATFCETLCKKLKKPCFFAFFANFVQSASKNVKKHCFLTLFVGRRAKSSKNHVFSLFFCELCTKCLEKREKNTVF